MSLFDWLRRPETTRAPRAARPALDAALVDGILTRVRAAPAGLRVLELECGVGVLSLRMAHAAPGCSVLGLDTASDAVRSASSAARAAGLESRVSFSVCDLRILSVADACFDLAVGVGVLSESAAPASTLREIRRALAPGGMALLYEPLALEEPAANAAGGMHHLRGASMSGAALSALIAASPFANAARLTAPESRGPGACAQLVLLHAPLTKPH